MRLLSAPSILSLFYSGPPSSSQRTTRLTSCIKASISTKYLWKHTYGSRIFRCHQSVPSWCPKASITFRNFIKDKGRLMYCGGLFRNDEKHQIYLVGNANKRLIHTSCFPLTKDFTPTPEDKDPSLEWLRSGKEFLNGPDQIIPSTALCTWDIRGAVALSKLGAEPGISHPPLSIPTLFRRRVEKSPDVPALVMKSDGHRVKWTYEEYYEDCKKVAKAFIALGLERFHSVCILGLNSPEWVIANMGAIFAGGIPTGIYTTNSAATSAYIANDSRANIFLVDDEQQLSKVLQYKKSLPYLKAIVQYKGKPTADGVLSWNDLLELGAEQSDEELTKRLKQMGVNQCSTLIYTSGTTGSPKGVMLSHDNSTWLSWLAIEFFQMDPMIVHDVVSYLPLSHVAAQSLDIYAILNLVGTVHFADRDALKGSLINTLVEVQPTIFLAVPRVWEKFYEKLKEIRRNNTGLKRKIADWAKAQAFAYNEKFHAGHPSPETFQFKLADKLILSKIRHSLGLSRCELCTSAAAPLSMDILNYFLSLNVNIGEAYGLSESSGPHTINLPYRRLLRFGSIGVSVGDVATKIDKPTSDGQGEICLGGRNILMGYLNQEQTTKNAIDEEGWLHTEDLGRKDKDGFLYITGRLKELLITAGGENVAPVPIEDNIKSALPCLANVMVIGDKLKFLSALMTLQTETDPNTNEPQDKLKEYAKEWIEKHGSCVVNTVSDVLDEVHKKKNSKLINALNTGVVLANSKCVSRASKVRKWVILPKDFSIKGGELGPTLKLRRSVAIEKYRHVVDEIYKDGFDPNSTGALG